MLTSRQLRFIDEYMLSFNGTQSAIKVGYSEHSAYNQAYKLLNKKEIKEEIERRTQVEHEKSVMKREEILKKLTDIANGKPIPVYYESIKDVDGKRSKRETKGLKTADTKEQLKALELLGKHYGLFTDKQDINLNNYVTFIDDI